MLLHLRTTYISWVQSWLSQPRNLNVNWSWIEFLHAPLAMWDHRRNVPANLKVRPTDGLLEMRIRMRRIIRILRLMRMKRIRMRRFLTMLRIKNKHVKYTRILCSPTFQFPRLLWNQFGNALLLPRLLSFDSGIQLPSYSAAWMASGDASGWLLVSRRLHHICHN